jgi:DNA-binding NarL/FixJ family response regulator
MTNFPRNLIAVLLIDDHQIILDGLAAVVDSETKAMKVVGRTSTPEQAYQLAKELKPDVIMLDLDLGHNKDGDKIRGLDLIPELTKEGEAKVLILTGELDVAIHAEAIKLGAKGVVLKNSPAETIIQAIKKVADGARWHSDKVLDYLMTNRQMDGKSKVDPEAENIASLTPMQLRVIGVVAANITLTNKQIAKQLHMSEHTLKNHLTEINSKLRTKNKMDLFMFAKKHNLDKVGS